ncbi:MAG TPA: aldo/keto reductase [Caulobacteraceae bacterium]|jgi:diketogulonate reductase-like aldo/keto reductase
MTIPTVSAAGVEIPALGFGTWQLTGDTCRRLVGAALRLGYRHIDTAAIYGNEREVGEAIGASGVPREEVFLTTKIWNDAHRDGELQNAAEASLRRLGVDHVDLLLLHWPVPEVPLAESLDALNEVLERGWTRSIGVSNFTAPLISEAVEASRAPLATNQLEYHPYLSQKTLLGHLRRDGISLTAYSPLAHGRLLDDAALAAIGVRHGKSVGQVALRWLVQQEGVIAIPKTGSDARAAENLSIFDFSLSEEEMASVADLARPDGRVIDPDWSPQWDPD